MLMLLVMELLPDLALILDLHVSTLTTIILVILFILPRNKALISFKVELEA
jgi:hypothetical protein